MSPHLAPCCGCGGAPRLSCPSGPREPVRPAAPSGIWHFAQCSFCPRGERGATPEEAAARWNASQASGLAEALDLHLPDPGSRPAPARL